MIQMYHVYKTYGRDSHALVDASLKVEKGEFVFLCGPSGAGKTTLLRILYREELPTKGQVIVNGHNLVRMKKRQIPYFRRQLGVVFQDFKLLPTRTVFENVAFALRVIGAEKTQVHRKTYQVLKLVGLDHKWNAMPLELSGGEQQRVAIARAMINDPLLLLADEPTGNLDPEISLTIMGLLSEINIRGTTVMVATHNTALVEKMGRRVIGIKRGQIIAGGELSD